MIGSAASVLVLALLAAASDQPAQANIVYASLRTLIHVVVIPLSLTALLSGIAIGVGTHWGVLRHRWVSAKLGLVLASMLTGVLVMRPWTTELMDVTSALTLADTSSIRTTQWALAGAAALNILFATTSSILSIFKPGGRVRRARARGATG
jgi:hypothetical protein